MGLYPKKAANSVDTGGRCATRSATPVGTPWATRPWYIAAGSEARQPDDHEGEEDADGQDLGRVLEGGVHPRARPAVLGREAVHDPGTVGRAEGPHGEPEEQAGSAPKIQ